ncbi:MAG: hypothetical protein QOH39_446 [Verrucomicrobiota bacterium]|jgi:peptidoglycan hydrolase-like protein with peptidoglycan-binding domain
MKTGKITLLISLLLLVQIRADQTVENVQRTLKDQGFYYGEVTGEKNADTTAAIRRYQIRNGLQINGELNDETLRSINSGSSASVKPVPLTSPAIAARERSPVADAADLRDDAAPSNGATSPTQTQPFTAPGRDLPQSAPNAGQSVPAPGDLFVATPYENASLQVQRKVIADAQRLLASRGLFKAPIDGAYGEAMEFSIRAYQARVGLRPTGRLDLETLAALELLPGAHTPVFAPRRPLKPPEPVVRGEWVRP